MALIVGLGLSILGGSLFLSALNAAQAQRFLDDWSQRGGVPSAEAFAAAEGAALRAVRLFPGNSGAAWDRLGRVYDWAHWQRPIPDRANAPEMPPPAALRVDQPLARSGLDNHAESRLRALMAYQAAVDARPLWPHGLTRLAYARLRAGAVDAELERLLARAYDLGPWRPAVNRRIAEIGLLGWPSLSGESRRLVLENARRAAHFSPADARRVAELARIHNLETVVGAVALP
jgi:hypothetical protein